MAISIPGHETGSNRQKIDCHPCRHCKGHHHLEVRLSALRFGTVIRQRFFFYLEWTIRAPLTTQLY